MGGEPLAFQLQRVDADVDEHLDALVALDPEGVAGGHGGDERARDRGVDGPIGGDDPQPVAHGGGSEDLVLDLAELDDPPVDGGGHGQRGAGSGSHRSVDLIGDVLEPEGQGQPEGEQTANAGTDQLHGCLLYTSDAADE